jgi:hypothetical protein
VQSGPFDLDDREVIVVSVPSTVPSTVLPSSNVTFTSVAPATTGRWWAIRPSEAMMKPGAGALDGRGLEDVAGSMTVVRIDTTPSRYIRDEVAQSVTSPVTLSSWAASPPSVWGRAVATHGAARSLSAVITGIDDRHGGQSRGCGGSPRRQRTTGSATGLGGGGGPAFTGGVPGGDTGRGQWWDCSGR